MGRTLKDKGKGSPQKPLTKTTPEVPFPCLVCKLDATEKVIKCDLCNLWCHYQCAEIDEETSDKYVKNKKLHWFCSSCEPHAMSLLDRVKVLESNNDKFAKEFRTGLKNLGTSIDTQVANVMRYVENTIEAQTEAKVKEKVEAIIDEKLEQKFTTKLEEVKQTYAETVKTNAEINTNADTIEADVTTKVNATLDAKIQDLRKDLNNVPQASAKPTNTLSKKQVTTEVWDAISEKERIENKKCNLIFSNIQETNSIQNDESVIKTIVKDKLNITEDIKIKMVARLGNKVTPDKPRLLKVIFESLHHKKLVLRKATQMRNLPNDDTYADVYIRPDLTKLQIETSKNLTAELKEKREHLKEGKWVIRKGVVIDLNAIPNERNNQQ